ncbi:MAG: phosphatidylglycerophosphatase A [Pseudomonadota bacterium]
MLPQMICTVFGIGYLRPGPGTWGSLAALPLAWALHSLGGATLLGMMILVVFFVGLWGTVQMTSGADNHDPSEIVIDEVVGQWIALLPVSLGASMRGVDITALWPGWVAAFVLFRFFDIVKPGLVRRADLREDAVGVMLDDVVAGVFAALGTAALAAIAHGILLP